ncbi:MAG: hypothetical protein ACRCZF_24475, partial [Gemmataceae bacterium]
SMLVSKSMTAHIPLAERYRRYWLKRTLYWAVPLVMSILGFILVAALDTAIPPDLQGFCYGANLVGAMGSLLFAVILSSTGLRTIKMTDRDMTLNGVHENFIAAIEEQRSARRALRRKRRGEPTDDDYDDE